MYIILYILKVHSGSYKTLSFQWVLLIFLCILKTHSGPNQSFSEHNFRFYLLILSHHYFLSKNSEKILKTKLTRIWAQTGVKCLNLGSFFSKYSLMTVCLTCGVPLFCKTETKYP